MDGDSYSDSHHYHGQESKPPLDEEAIIKQA